MDDNKKIVTAKIGEVEYAFRAMSEGQITAVVLSQSLGELELLRTAGLVLTDLAEDDSWRKLLRALATDAVTTNDFVTLIRDLIQGSAGAE